MAFTMFALTFLVGTLLLVIFLVGAVEFALHKPQSVFLPLTPEGLREAAPKVGNSPEAVEQEPKLVA